MPQVVLATKTHQISILINPNVFLTIGSLSSIRRPFKATEGIFAVDALNISRMNMRPRGKQAAVHQGYTVGRMSTKGVPEADLGRTWDQHKQNEG